MMYSSGKDVPYSGRKPGFDFVRPGPPLTSQNIHTQNIQKVIFSLCKILTKIPYDCFLHSCFWIWIEFNATHKFKIASCMCVHSKPLPNCHYKWKSVLAISNLVLWWVIQFSLYYIYSLKFLPLFSHTVYESMVCIRSIQGFVRTKKVKQVFSFYNTSLSHPILVRH